MSDGLLDQLKADLSAARQEVDKLEGLIARMEGKSEATGRLTVPLEEFNNEALLDWEWLFGGVIPTGSTGILAGDPKSGKSTLATQMALCLGVGRQPFYDCRVSRAAKVLYIAAEGARAAYQNRVRTAAKSLGIPMSGADASRWFIQKQSVTDYILGSRSMDRMLEETKPDLVICDTIGFFHKGNENDATDVKRHIIAPAKVHTAKHGCAFLFLHHQVKESAERKGAQRVRGSTALLGDCDYLLQLDNVPGDEAMEKKVLALTLSKYSATRRWDLKYDAAAARFG